MQQRVRIAPARAGLIVRDPITLLPLAQSGEEKVLTGYWRRRLKAGEVVTFSETAPEPKAKKAKE